MDTATTANHYQAWQAAHLEATFAYLDWRDAAPEHRRDAYAVYRAAADREDAAAASWLKAGPG
jgi:hypothetical protein